MNPVRLLRRMRESLLLIPALSTAGAILLSAVTEYLDGRWGTPHGWFLGGPDSSRSLLGAIASASMTLTGVVFSITMLVLQLASSQYSPRVLGTFLRDRVGQAALGMFTATFAFSLAALRTVGPNGVPIASVSVAFGLALATLAMFVVYVNHIARQIQVSSIIAAIRRDTERGFDRTYANPRNADGDPAGWPPPGPLSVVAAPRGGVVAGVAVNRIVAAARDLDVAVELVPAVGDFVAGGAPLLRVFRRGDGDVDEDRLVCCVDVADERDLAQDPAYGIRQLVDIAERALSPGVNDPTTAVESIRAVHNVLVRVATVDVPSGIACDDDGTVRFRRRYPGFDDVVRLAVDELLLYGRHSLQVTAALEAMLSDLLRVTAGERTALVRDKLRHVDRERRALLDDDAWFAAPRTVPDTAVSRLRERRP